MQILFWTHHGAETLRVVYQLFLQVLKRQVGQAIQGTMPQCYPGP